MAQYQAAYKFSLFDSYDYGTSAPKLEPVYEPEVKQKKKAPVKKQSKAASKAQVKATRASLVSSVKIVLVLVFIFSAFSMAMYL